MSERPYVLMADDEPDWLTVVGAWLETRYDHCAVKDVDELTGALRVRKPDVLVLDVAMPGVDGIEFCKRLRHDPRYSDLPVLFLTGHRDVETTRRLDECGANATLPKPVSRYQLFAAIESLLSGAAPRARVSQ